MAHLDLLSRSRCVPADIYCPLGTPGPTIIHLLRVPLVLDISWVKVQKIDPSFSAFCIRIVSFCNTSYERDEGALRSRTILSRCENRLSEATRYARCHPIGSKGHGGDVCIHRPAVFRLNKSLSLRFFFGKSMRALVSSSCIVRSFAHCCLFFPRDTSLFYSVCFLILRRAYKRILTLDDSSFLRCTTIFTCLWKFFVIYIYVKLRYYANF